MRHLFNLNQYSKLQSAYNIVEPKMRNIKCLIWIVLALLGVINTVQANNIQVSNIQLTGESTLERYVQVQFNLSWENSWRVSDAPGNWDAAWVFVKFKVKDPAIPGNGVWRHALLNDTGHNPGSGTAASMELGLKNDKLPFNVNTNPGIGMLVYRSANGSGSFSATGMQLRWNHIASGVPPGAELDIRVYAIEMVYIPEGAFWLGDGSSSQNFRQVSANSPYQVTTSGAPLKCEPGGDDDAQLRGSGIWVDGDGGVSRSAANETDINADFPTGFKGFYCMKYEISQGQYRDFLNTLTRSQQQTRVGLDTIPRIVTNRYVMSNSTTMQNRNGLRCDSLLTPVNAPITIYCDFNGNGIRNQAGDGEWLACNFLNWADGIAYMDWSGLRPLTELELEKASRGTNVPVAGEYAWGTTEIATSSYTLSSAGTNAEGIASGYNASGNAHYFDQIGGPFRVGIFAGHPSNTNRATSGAGYYGVMELSGNLWERSVTIGRLEGRLFTGQHGDGALATNGNADVSFWPGVTAVGSNYRNGSWLFPSSRLQVSDRSNGAFSLSVRNSDLGFRGCRSAPNMQMGN